ncbi:MAG: hypothetical protein BMS9Abin37_1168 [Acidobacteriota bacterium]|nr:MAG: hypothetical protein BMS9Abin37_1168 [Acidobacteriota bacterium]
MALTAGERLGAYEILAVGAGGMEKFTVPAYPARA